MKELLYKLKENKKILTPIASIVLLIVILAGVSFAVFNFTNTANNNNINSGHISFNYTEQSNEYKIENALPMKDYEGMNSTNYFEFSVTTKAPTNDTDENGVSIPYEISITELEGNTLTNDKIKMYLTEVEGEKEIDHTIPTLVSLFEPSLYKNEGIKVGFNLHFHINGNETITTKYRLRAWIDKDVDVSDWNTANKYQYKFKVNVNGEATYQGYETNPSCFALEENDRGNYSITGYDFNKCGSKNIVVPTHSNDTKTVLYKEITAINWSTEEEFLAKLKTFLITEEEWCSDYGTVNTDEDWENCIINNGYNSVEEFNEEYTSTIPLYKSYLSFINDWVGDNYYDYEQEIANNGIDYFEKMGYFTIETSEEEEKTIKIKIDEIKSFNNTIVAQVNNKKDADVINDLNNVLENEKNKILKMADNISNIDVLIVSEKLKIEEGAFSEGKVNKLIDKKGMFPKECYAYTLYDNNGQLNEMAVGYYKCEGIKETSIPATINGYRVTQILSDTFSYKRLGSVRIPNSIIKIGDDAFRGSIIDSIDLPNNITTLNSIFINTDIKRIVIPDSVVTIEQEAFFGSTLEQVEIGKGVTMIDDYAFSETNLTNLVIPDNVKEIGYAAFTKSKLKSITIPENIIIGDASFKDNNLTSVVIPNGIPSIGDYAFCGNKLVDVTISNDVTSIGEWAFEDNKLTNIEIPDSVTSIGKFAFHNNKLETIEIPVGITTIEFNTFSYNNLTKVVIPNSVTTIETYAFKNNQLISVTIPSSVTTIEQMVFNQNPNLVKIVNLTQKSFDWRYIIDGISDSRYTFVTGTFSTDYGNVEVIAE